MSSGGDMNSGANTDLKAGMSHQDGLNTILLDYVEAVERGEKPDREMLLTSFPQYAEELKEFFATRDRLDRIASPLRDAVGSSRWHGIGDATGPLATAFQSVSGAGIGRIGDFRLLREVGRGGMGVVYEAEQISLRRRVALKVLPFAAAIDPRHLQRFRNEAQAAAQLHHSNIVPVHAVGSDAGMHYYAMQFIDGKSLAQLLTELRESPNRQVEKEDAKTGDPLSSAIAEAVPLTHPTNTTLPIRMISTEHLTQRRRYFRRIIEFIRQAADALEYAHQVGVIHRDVKPANLMVDGVGRLWVADFGVALIRNDMGITATGELVGTIRYMSPEQALGKPGLVDHRTDVYSLGATLYESLTLAPVFKGDDREGFLRQLANDEPQLLRAIDGEIPSELETIVLKSLSKLPAERYASAREFADDLQRFLDDRPILARRPTLIDRGAKWVRRHRAATLTAVVILALAALGLGISTAIIASEHSQTKAALKREQDAKERERTRALEAEDHYLRTRRAVDLFVELSDEGLLDFPPLAPLRQRLLEAAVAYYQELSDRRDDEAVRKDLEVSRSRLERLQLELSAINGVNTILLLDQLPVQRQLELTAEQVNQLSSVLSELKLNQRSPMPTSKDGHRQPMAELVKAPTGKIEGILTAAQYKQLRQIYLQLPGPHAFEPSSLAALDLSASQKTLVRQIQAEATHASLRLFATTKSREQALGEAGGLWNRANEQIVSLLTPAQKAQWGEMIGPPISSEIHFPFPPQDRTP